MIAFINEVMQAKLTFIQMHVTEFTGERGAFMQFNANKHGLLQ